MHVSWTTLREQIFAKLRRPYRSEADMNEVGHGNTYLVNHTFYRWPHHRSSMTLPTETWWVKLVK
jgi:hypothetical protein